jgi:hypothetical protein
MTTWTINAKAETALREAISAVSRLEIDQIEPALGKLDELELAEALGLAVTITGYVAVDSCGTEWPTKHSMRRIADDVATTGTVSKTLKLDPEKIYQFLSRVVLGPEPLIDFISPEDPEYARFPVIIANRITGVYCPREVEIWDYMDQIESAIEAAWSFKPAVFPAAVLRAYLPSSKSGVKFRGRQKLACQECGRGVDAT